MAKQKLYHYLHHHYNKVLFPSKNVEQETEVIQDTKPAIALQPITAPIA